MALVTTGPRGPSSCFKASLYCPLGRGGKVGVSFALGWNTLGGEVFHLKSVRRARGEDKPVSKQKRSGSVSGSSQKPH